MAKSYYSPLRCSSVSMAAECSQSVANRSQAQSPNTAPRYLFRAVRSDDKNLINRGLGEMSLNSRYMRFFSAMNQLPGPLLEHLTDIDHMDHEAIGALDVSTDPPSPAAVARYIREEPESDRAEFAVAVVDAYQRQGLARVLLATLLIIAKRRGIDNFWCQVQFDNDAMRHLGAQFEAIEKLVPQQGLLLDISTDQRKGGHFGEDRLWVIAQTIADRVTGAIPD